MSDSSERPDPSDPSANAEGAADPSPAASETEAKQDAAPEASAAEAEAAESPAEAPAESASQEESTATSDDAKADDPKTDDLKTGDPKTDDLKTGDLKTGDPKTDDPKTDDLKTGDPKADAPKADDSKADDPEPAKADSGSESPEEPAPTAEAPESEAPPAKDPEPPAKAPEAKPTESATPAAGAAPAAAAPAAAAAAAPAAAAAAPAPAGASPEGGAAPAAEQEPEEETFLQGLWKTKVTLLCVGLIVLAFYLQVQAIPGKWIPTWQFTPENYLAHGGYLYSAVRDHNEWWRFVTGVFVARHGLSALVGVYLLFQMGGSMERILGSARTLPLIVLSGAGGLAVADLWFPARPASGPFVVGFALMGALPGVIWGVTGSLKRTAQVPAARSAAFFSVLWIGVYWFISAQFGMPMNFAGLIGGVLSAFVMGFALGMSRRDLVGGAVAFVLATGAIAFPAVMVSQGKRYLDGKLVPRGVPAGTKTPRQGPSKEATAKLANTAREEAAAVLDRFGKVPYYPETGEVGLDNDQAAEVGKVLKELTELADGTSMVTVQVEDLRARAHLLLGQGHAAKEISYLLVGSAPTPPNRALYAASLYASQNYEAALEELNKLLQLPGIDSRIPEVQYYAATTLFQLGRDEESQQKFQAYLSIVSGKPIPEWRERFVARAKRELGQ